MTSRFVADLISPIICKHHYNDETFNEITIKTTKSKNQNHEDYFSDFLKLINFNEQNIDEEHKKHYLEYFLQLGNMNEYFRLQPDYFDDITNENVISRIKSICQQNIGRETINMIDKLIEYAAANFDKLPKEELKTLDIEIIESIFGHQKLRLHDEDSLLEFILELYFEDDKFSVLFEYVIFKNVSEEELKKFVSQFDIEFLNSKIWKSVCQRFFSTNENECLSERYIEQFKTATFEHKEGSDFNGIFNFLVEKTKGNIHDNGTINVTSNSIYNDGCHPKNLFDYKNNDSNYYYSKSNISDAYVCFDFKDRKIQLSSYTIKSFGDSGNGPHLKNWTIEVSDDASKWTPIDVHQNDPTLNGSKIVATFKIKETTSFYRYVRLHQTGTNWQNNYYMLFHYLEFYGKLKEKK